jgi:hypothetical protein
MATWGRHLGGEPASSPLFGKVEDPKRQGGPLEAGLPAECRPHLMSAPSSCGECDRVWENYTQAVTAHVKIVARRHKAALQNDSAVLDEIAAIEADLAQQELKARRAIDDHEAEHEPALADRVPAG